MNATGTGMTDADITAFRPPPLPPRRRAGSGVRVAVLGLLLLAVAVLSGGWMLAHGLLDGGLHLSVNGHPWDGGGAHVLGVTLAALLVVGVVAIVVPLVLAFVLLVVVGVVGGVLALVLLVLLGVAALVCSPLLLLGALLWWALRPRRPASSTVSP